MTEYHTIAIISYPTIQRAIEDATIHNIWNREYNFMYETDTNEFYYDWIRVIKILHTFSDYLLKEKHSGECLNLPYSIYVNSGIPSDRYAFEGIRIYIEKYHNQFTFMSNYLIDDKKRLGNLITLYNISIRTFWEYYNSRIEILGIKGFFFRNNCIYIAQMMQ